MYKYELKDFGAVTGPRDPDEKFYSLCYADIYGVAIEQGLTHLTEDELHSIRKMIEAGMGWHEVTSIAVSEIKSMR